MQTRKIAAKQPFRVTLPQLVWEAEMKRGEVFKYPTPTFSNYARWLRPIHKPNVHKVWFAPALADIAQVHN